MRSAETAQACGHMLATLFTDRPTRTESRNAAILLGEHASYPLIDVSDEVGKPGREDTDELTTSAIRSASRNVSRSIVRASNASPPSRHCLLAGNTAGGAAETRAIHDSSTCYSACTHHELIRPFAPEAPATSASACQVSTSALCCFDCQSSTPTVSIQATVQWTS
ncbi:hypothetical protein E5Q_06251 [Mixia osmundae IAM 14324]|uniref:Uncharacterized protein n=1 Tax=Mixia osmundae (strain CBS 9802 / IAM 14324 / JCM 22182 / KY 12970) TaxID=764103 RepID=G7E8T2_MIXOS|nr:hypothetical protein E5Q_06251 [Mixia osmundae IAM 14324]